MATRTLRRPRSGVEKAVEVEAQGELHAARRVGGAVQAGEVDELKSELAVTSVSGMVKEVEVFPAKIEAGFFADGKAPEDADIEIQAARQVKTRSATDAAARR
mgnify:CR=1 FL=1